MEHTSNSDFYIKNNFLPTKTAYSLDNPMDYNSYKKQRLYLLENLLNIPVGFIANANYLEIGPDSGENALFAATLGAKITCVDPNPLSNLSVKKLFEEYKNGDLKGSLIKNDLNFFEDFESDHKFNFIACEGMIHSVADKEKFIKKMSKLIDDQGIILLSYVSNISTFADLFHSKLFKDIAKEKIGFNAEGEINDLSSVVKFGSDLFYNKWSRINHLRSLDTWVLDVLLNPVVGVDRTIDVLKLLESFHEFRINFWRSWPHYEPSGVMRWHRKIQEPSELLSELEVHYKKMSLQFLLGSPTDFMQIVDDLTIINKLEKICKEINQILDKSDWLQLKQSLESLQSMLKDDSSFKVTNDLKRILSIVNMLCLIINLLVEKNYSQLIKLIKLELEVDKDTFDFGSYWGQPNHYLALYKNL